MDKRDIHKLIEEYFDATLSAHDETLLMHMLSQTDEDTEDIREAKATMGLFAMNRKLTGKKLRGGKSKSVWGGLKYAAVFVIGLLLSVFLDLDLDDSMDNDVPE